MENNIDSYIKEIDKINQRIKGVSLKSEIFIKKLKI